MTQTELRIKKKKGKLLVNSSRLSVIPVLFVCIFVASLLFSASLWLIPQENFAEELRNVRDLQSVQPETVLSSTQTGTETPILEDSKANSGKIELDQNQISSDIEIVSLQNVRCTIQYSPQHSNIESIQQSVNPVPTGGGWFLPQTCSDPTLVGVFVFQGKENIQYTDTSQNAVLQLLDNDMRLYALIVTKDQDGGSRYNMRKYVSSLASFVFPHINVVDISRAHAARTFGEYTYFLIGNACGNQQNKTTNMCGLWKKNKFNLHPEYLFDISEFVHNNPQSPESIRISFASLQDYEGGITLVLRYKDQKAYTLLRISTDSPQSEITAIAEITPDNSLYSTYL